MQMGRGTLARAGAGLFVSAVLVAGAASSAAAATRAHGDLLHLAKPGTATNANQSNNWFGYNQGYIEQGRKHLFHAITGDWTVPAASQHTSGQDEFSSDWIGIGGGCVDANCNVTDNTLIQTGTEQDVSGGNASYSAWWEVIPGPSLRITTVHPSAGDRMHASIAEAVTNSNVWKIVLRDVTKGQTFTKTVPYSSTHLTAEWIEETPLVFGTGGVGLAALPNLGNPNFDLGTTDGAAAGLKPSEEIQLVDNSGRVIGSPSGPDSDADGFGACTWATSCSAPGS